jgi:hypothetical protein
VKDRQGRPIPGLAEKNFRVYEDGKLVTTSKGKRALLEPKEFDKRYVLLLVDMSGPIADSEDLPELAAAIGGFVDHVGATHEIAVGVFDGDDAVVPFLGYSGTADTKKVVASLQKFRPRSRNANLNGAVYQGLHSLRAREEADRRRRRPLRLLVLLAQAPGRPPRRGRGRDVTRPRPPDVQVQRGRLHRRLHAEKEAGPRARRQEEGRDGRARRRELRPAG